MTGRCRISRLALALAAAWLAAAVSLPRAGLAQTSFRAPPGIPPRAGFGVRTSTAHPWGQAVLGITLEGDRRGPAEVVKVKRNSAAEEAGLRPGDIILEMNGRRIRNYRDVQNTVKSYLPNDLLKIVIDHKGKRRRLIAILGGAPPPSEIGEHFSLRIPDDARH